MNFQRVLYNNLNRNFIVLRSLSSTKQIINPKYSQYYEYTNENGYQWKSIYGDIKIPTAPLHEHIWKDINKWQNKIALTCGITNRKYTYSKLRDHCAAFANNLQTKFKLTKSNVIAVCLPNIPEFTIATLGAIEAGLCVTTLNPIYTADEIARQFLICQPKLIVGTIDIFDVLQNACNIAKLKVPIMIIKLETNQSLPRNVINFFDMIETNGVNLNNFKRVYMDVDDTCLLPFSSGTTGLPKGVMLTHSNITSNMEMLDTPLPIDKFIRPTTDDFQDVLSCFLPFFHIYGLTCSLLSKLGLGCHIVTLPKFTFDTFLSTLTDHKATFLHLVPAIIYLLANHENILPKHLQHVRYVMSGAAPLGSADVERFQIKAPNVSFSQGYGLTETSPASIIQPIGDQNFESIGYPVPGSEMKIIAVSSTNDSIGDTGNSASLIGLGPNENGELLVRGPHVTKGYFKNLESTNNAITVDGWFRTGDMACYDNDGYVYLKDRLKELIKVKGFQVSPTELEESLRNHPKILDAGVIGISHPIKGQLPFAFVVKQKGAEISGVEIQNYIAEKFAEYKHLHGGVRFIDAIPKNATGKIMRKHLNEML